RKVLPNRTQFRFDPIRLFRSLWSRNAPFASRKVLPNRTQFRFDPIRLFRIFVSYFVPKQ
uniref:hypothetical protein n=1 Tax=Alistipes shahii TaxID=328814 RepID=UPI002592D20B